MRPNAPAEECTQSNFPDSHFASPQLKSKFASKDFCVDKSRWVVKKSRPVMIRPLPQCDENSKVTACPAKSIEEDSPIFNMSNDEISKTSTATSTPICDSSKQSGSASTKSGSNKIVVKRRADFLKTKISSTASSLANSAVKVSMSDNPWYSSASWNPIQAKLYFVKHLKTCHETHDHFCLDENRVNETVKFQQLYFENNHRTLQLMKSDCIVERPKNIHIVRKYPHRKLLLLDLDETLIHCSGDLSLGGLFDQEVDFINQDGVPLTGLLNVRPGACQFLQNMSANFEVVIFTASMKYYADRILKILDPTKQFISHVFYRESCAKTRLDKLVKDLSVFGNVPLEDMILVDNNMYCMWPQPQNGIPILNFEHDRGDQELLQLEHFLLSLRDTNHLPRLREHFKVHTVSMHETVAGYLSLFKSVGKTALL